MSNIITETTASNGKAASIVGTTKEWAIQVNLSKFLDASPDEWHIYAMVRVDTNADALQVGAGLSSGIYDATNHKFISQVTISVKEVADSTYQQVDLGEHKLNGGMTIWFAPTQNPAVTKVYVDRILLIREK